MLNVVPLSTGEDQKDGSPGKKGHKGSLNHMHSEVFGKILISGKNYFFVSLFEI
jgi:hypothetical protein